MSIRSSGLVAAFGLVVAQTAAAHPASAKLCDASIEAINQSVARTLAQGSPGMSVAVASKGEPLFMGSYGLADLEHQAPVTRETIFKLASVTKQFTAAAILQLAEQGKLRLTDKLSLHVPEFPHGDEITLYQLITLTSGIPDYAEDPAGSKTKSVAKTPEEMLAWIIRLSPKLQFAPGSKWAYSNSNYALLGLIAERVDGKPLAAQFEERLFKPAGLRSTRFDDPTDVVPNRAQGYRRDKTAPSGFANAEWISPTVPGPGGGLRTSADDLILWSNALFSGRIVSPDSLKMMTAAGLLGDGRTTKFGMPEAWQKGLNSDYGMGVFVNPSPAGTRIWHSGDMPGFSTWLAHYPKQDLTIALLMNSESADMDKDAIEAAVFASLDGKCGPAAAP